MADDFAHFFRLTAAIAAIAKASKKTLKVSSLVATAITQNAIALSVC
jgi:hypothetical protein